MADKLVAVDGGLHLPAAVRTQLSADLTADMSSYVSAASTAAGTATSAASSASTSASAAAAAAIAASAPTDAMVKSLVLNPASLTYDAIYDTFSQSLTGVYGGRPAANTVPIGTIYYATDVPEVYRSTGSVWVAHGSGGNEIGYAQILSNFTTTSTTNVDVTGLTSTFVVGERPIVLRFDGVLGNSAAATATFACIMLDGTQVASCGRPEVLAGGFSAVSRSVRISGLTPGSTHTAKIQARSASAGTATVYGGSTNVSAITIETA